MKRWLILAVVVAAVLGVGGPFVYVNFISGEAPAPLGLPQRNEASSPKQGFDGTWTVAGGSQVGYRVNEVVFGQDNVAVGRTGTVTGTIEVSGTTVKAASFTVDMTTFKSDQSRRDNQFQGRIMDTATYPTSTFKLTDPIEVASIPAEGIETKVTAKGELTLRGTTKTVTVAITGRRSGDAIQVSGSIPITFAEWNIPNPSIGPVSARQNGLLEFSINFARGG